MDRIIGIDLAKQYFQVHAANHRGEVIERRKLTRDKVRTYMSAQQPAVVVMEACGSAHHWSREFAAMGHTVRLIAPQYVKAFVKLWRGDHNLTNHQVTIMRRNAGQTHGTRPVALLFANFAAHYFPANLCSLLTSRGVIDVEI